MGQVKAPMITTLQRGSRWDPRPSRTTVLLALLSTASFAQPVTRTFFTLPSSNGAGAVMADARTATITHFREQLPATEEPLLDASGMEVWNGNQPQMVAARDLLFDASFGVRANGTQQWIRQAADESGYLTAAPSPHGGSGMISWKHRNVLGLEATTVVFAPRSLTHASFVMALKLENTGTTAVTGVRAYSLHNFHLGFGRPGVMSKLQANGETIVVHAGRELEERGFAGVVVSRPIGPVSKAAAWTPASTAAENGFRVVNETQGELLDRSGALPTGDDWASAFQFDLGDLAPGQSQWVAVVVAHHGDPFAVATVRSWLDAFVSGASAQQLVDTERLGWERFQQALRLPSTLSPDEAFVARQSAVVLAMAQVTSREAFLREVLSRDGEPRRTRFRTSLGSNVLPATIVHRGKGAVIASLPPGEWTVAWPRDGAYAAAALATVGLSTEARDALTFFLDAEGGRFQRWNELSSYQVPPYRISLTRYTGFGVEETDFNQFGPNLEFDGFGLALWALRHHELQSSDRAFIDARWNDIATTIADPIVALIDPSTGLLRKDSSIWETHWNGRERTWTYTNLTAVRGLCDAAAMAEARQDGTRAMRYRTAALALRQAIINRLTDGTGALASNREELASGTGHFDAATFEGVAMGIFAPQSREGLATSTALDRLRVTAGPGWSRNDDRSDHGGATDLSPWGSEYDSAEWVITDLRGSIALRAQGDSTRANAVLDWVTRNGVANAGLIPETFDERTGAWKFNAPMVGFGAGAYLLALAQRDRPIDPACGATPIVDGGVDAGSVDAGNASDAGVIIDAGAIVIDAGLPGDAGMSTPPKRTTQCQCALDPGLALPVLLLTLLARFRRRARS